jgi:hypothetical protein
MSFQVIGLPYRGFSPLFALSDAELAARRARRFIADRARFGRMPCRVSLRDAEDGNVVILLNYEHLSVDTPYRSHYAIYVRENASECAVAPGETPEVMHNRPLSLRAFSAGGMLLDACLAQGPDVADRIARLLDNDQADYLHVHNAMHGCFAARVERA